MPRESYLPPDFFSPRWISRYIAESIRLYGDISLAYDLLLQDASLELRKRLGLKKER